MIIDAHAHYIDEEGYLDRLVVEERRLGIEKICLSGIGSLFNCKSNKDVRKAMEEYPNVIIGFGFVRPGVDPPELVDKLYSEGFRGVKITCPRKNYDDKEYYPIYAACERYEMLILFHTGIVTLQRVVPKEDVSSAWMRPVYLDTIAKAFPRLNMICAHMGMPWYAEACEVARLNPNVYLDISGAPNGFRSHKKPEFFKDMLWWEGAFKKVIFGTDVHYSDIASVLEYDRKLYSELEISEETQKGIFGDTMAKLLGIAWERSIPCVGHRQEGYR